MTSLLFRKKALLSNIGLVYAKIGISGLLPTIVIKAFAEASNNRGILLSKCVLLYSIALLPPQFFETKIAVN